MAGCLEIVARELREGRSAERILADLPEAGQVLLEEEDDGVTLSSLWDELLLACERGAEARAGLASRLEERVAEFLTDEPSHPL
jgi:hypothetical protein